MFRNASMKINYLSKNICTGGFLTQTLTLVFTFPKRIGVTCTEYEMAKKNKTVTSELTEKVNAHLDSKNATREERNTDRSLKDESSAIICFDLQNVISCPRANTSNLLYKRKLNVFNITAHSSLSPHAYCCIWHEGIAGRGGNEIASCLIAMLERFVENHPNVKHLVLWSDSCVPQDRNSMMLTALKDCIDRSDIKTIVQNSVSRAIRQYKRLTVSTAKSKKH